MINPNEMEVMQETARRLITTVFEYEEQLKEHYIFAHLRWQGDEYEFNRVHLSGHRMRITIRFEDYSEHDVYLDLSDVYKWYLELGEEIIGKQLTTDNRPDNVEGMEAYQSGVYVDIK